MSALLSAVGRLLARWRRRLWILRTLRGPARAWALRRYLESPGARAARLSAARLDGSGRLVFVCHGNIMRSAFATRVARAHRPDAAERIVGAGTHARVGRSAQDTALEVSRELALSLDDHSATPLDAVGLGAADVIVCMDVMNEANVLASYPALAARVFRVGDIEMDRAASAHADREIHDPYGRGVSATRDAFDRVTRLSQAWSERLSAR